jgi:hypothetical protein
LTLLVSTDAKFATATLGTVAVVAVVAVGC